jgi:hypothetical protein
VLFCTNQFGVDGLEQTLLSPAVKVFSVMFFRDAARLMMNTPRGDCFEKAINLAEKMLSLLSQTG